MQLFLVFPLTTPYGEQQHGWLWAFYGSPHIRIAYECSMACMRGLGGSQLACQAHGQGMACRPTWACCEKPCLKAQAAVRRVMRIMLEVASQAAAQ